MACWVRSDRLLLASADAVGEVVEACNSPGGFTVVAQYRQLKLTEAAKMIYDGQRIDMAKGGSQMLRRSSMATIKRVAYRFDEVTLDEPLVLSLTIQPI